MDYHHDHGAGSADQRDPAGDQPAAASAGASHDHSTLEVDHRGPDYGKIVVFPGPDYDKEVVQGQPSVPAYDDQKKHHTAVPWSAWQGDVAEAGDTGNAGPVERATFCGLKRRTFFVVLWVASILVAIAVGVGTGVGVTMRSRSDSTDTGTIAEGTADTVSSGSPPTQTQPSTSSTATSQVVPTNTSPSPTSAAPSSSTSSAPQSTTSLQIGGIGGRCSNEWGGDCICLEQGICENVWKGTPYTGSAGNWPCPNDPDGIMACVVAPCLGEVAPAACLWREACRELGPGNRIHFMSLPLEPFPSSLIAY
ncbi:hypothetical protein C8A00DRAFT_17885 [Chaetomidium leptoderma]|uniref:Uncharacterized protein n=1 Tax=Chaetomidium leptoderma TaxID=669021 RepID=A0AAN6ZUJ0_9PEZI|nr:hypothetical protein C8A00DRAFT_17885 [Chaetomidium leptoderma]